MILVDTGFLLALAQPTDALHGRALAWARFLSDSLVVSEYVVWEVVNHLSKPADRGRGHRIVWHVTTEPSYQFLPATAGLFQAGLKLHQQRLDKEWSLTDCISFTIMHQHGIARALAYDQHFEQAGFEALLRTDPPSSDL
jgi:predicted nucleic acid-binding protein